jgi:predicted HAD superfamily Cof-like phosphohydrolase
LSRSSASPTTNGSNQRGDGSRQAVYDFVTYDSCQIEEELVTAGKWEDPVIMAADAMADMLYFLHGTALVSGVPLQAVFSAVHGANMAKLGPNGEVLRRADGKILKPKGWKPADIGEVLKVYGWHR